MRAKLFGHSANDLFWFILPLILPSLLAKYNLSYTEAGGILTIYLAAAAIGSFIMGKLSDYISRKHILSFGFLLASTGLIAAGFAPSLFIFLLLIAVTAIGVSTFHPVMYAVIDETCTVNKGKFLGVYEGFGAGAILLMFLVNGFLVNWIGIPGILILAAVPGLIMGLIFYFSSAIPQKSQSTSDREYNPAKPDRKRISRFYLFLISIILRIMSITAILNFLPTIFVNFFGFEQDTAAFGILMGIMTITASLSPALFGMIVDNAGFNHAIIIFTLPLLFSACILMFLQKSDKLMSETNGVTSQE